MMLIATVATAISAAMLLLIGLGDPKRRRAAGRRGGEHGRGTRRALVAATLLPGLYCAAIGDSAAFLMWLGGCAVIGWLIAILLRPHPQGRA